MQSVGYVVAGAASVHFAPFIHIFGLKACLAGGGLGFGTFVGKEEVTAHKSAAATSKRFGFFGKKQFNWIKIKK